MWNVKKLLDHGYVTLLDSMPRCSDEPSATGLVSGDARIVQAARVSMAHFDQDILESLGIDFSEQRESRTSQQDEKLINYLMSNKHWSPFEQVKFTFIVKLPIFVARQWIRHRTMQFNEMSARYTKLPFEFYVPELDRMQAQSTSNKQASGGVLPSVLASRLRAQIERASANAYQEYEELLSQGLARELARMVLPTNFYTVWYCSVDLRNLMNFFELRLHHHAQYEIRVYAEAMIKMVEEVCPLAVKAFRTHIFQENA